MKFQGNAISITASGIVKHFDSYLGHADVLTNRSHQLSGCVRSTFSISGPRDRIILIGYLIAPESVIIILSCDVIVRYSATNQRVHSLGYIQMTYATGIAAYDVCIQRRCGFT
jgi:hypothetical protein